MYRKNLLFIAGCIILLIQSSCSSEYTNTSTENCYRVSNGENIFMGDDECFHSIPRREMQGYLVVDHEYSVYYEDRNKIEPGVDLNATWAVLGDDIDPSYRIYLNGEGRKVYRISFIGAEGPSNGMYGDGSFKSGIFIYRINSISLVE